MQKAASIACLPPRTFGKLSCGVRPLAVYPISHVVVKKSLSRGNNAAHLRVRSAKRELLPSPPDYGITDEMLAKVIESIGERLDATQQQELIGGLRVQVWTYLGPLWLDQQFGNSDQTVERLAKIERLIQSLLDEIEGLHPVLALCLSGAGQSPSKSDNRVNGLPVELDAYLTSIRELKWSKHRRIGRPGNGMLRLMVLQVAQLFQEATGEPVIASVSRASGYDSKLKSVAAGSMLAFMKLLEPKLGEADFVAALKRARKARGADELELSK